MTDVSGVSEFKEKARQGALVALPSGNQVRIRNPGMQVFLQRGMIPDSLTPIVRKALSGGVEPDEKDLREAMSQSDIEGLFKLFDDVVMSTWVQPKVHPVPEDESDRDDSLLYVDEIEFDDKSFTFQFAVGGVRDLESFREQQEEMLERLSAGQDMVGET